MRAATEHGAYKSIFRYAGRKTLDAIFPPVCVVCRAQVDEPGGLCAACWGRMNFIDGPFCVICGLPFDLDPESETICGGCHARRPDFDHARAVLRYDDASRGLALALKWADRLDLVEGFSAWLKRTGRQMLSGCDLIVPVPLHRRRLWSRRYNQAALLADCLSRDTATPCDVMVLRRIKPTASQGEMPSARARQRNVRGAFGILPSRKGMIVGKSVLLIDDVFTTGATLNACARVLKRGGAARVDALALARVCRPNSG